MTRAATIIIRYPIDTPELARIEDQATKIALHEDALASLVSEIEDNWPGSNVELHYEDLTSPV